MALSDNLQGWWCPSLDTSGNGTTTLTDLSGNGKNASMVNMDADTVADTDDDTDSDGNQDAWVIEDGLRALRFVATDSAKATTPHPTFGFGEDNFSVACWVKLETVDSGFVSPLIWGHPNFDGATWFGFQKNSSDQWRFVVDDNVTLRSVTNGSTVASGVWYHLVGTREYGGNIKFYLNNSLVGTVSDNGNSITSLSNDVLRFGYQITVNNPAGQEFLNGCLDQVGVWDRVITDDEVTQLYNGGRSLQLVDLSTGLQGWWCPSRDTSGNGTTTLTDLSGNGNNGTLTNMDAATDWVADTDSGGVRALDFDGVDDYVATTLSAPSNQIMSLAIWFRCTASGLQILAHSGFEALPQFFVSIESGVLYLRFGSGNIYQTASSGLNDGAWHNATVTCNTATANSSSYSVYIDGVLTSGSASGSSTWSDMSAYTAWTIASRIPFYFGEVVVDGFAIWNRALTAAEVTQIYNGGRSFNLLSTGATIVPQLLLRRRRLSGGLVI